jgi:hypothetical protein
MLIDSAMRLRLCTDLPRVLPVTALSAVLTLILGLGPAEASQQPASGQTSGTVYVRPSDDLQAAIDSLPAGGGVIEIAPSSAPYKCPKSIPSGVTLRAQGGRLPRSVIQLTGAGPWHYESEASLVRFACSSAVTIADVHNIAVIGVIFDFQNTPACGNLTLAGVSFSEFDIAVAGACPTSPAITLTGTAANPSVKNTFHRIVTHRGSKGVVLTGSPPPQFMVFTENRFEEVDVYADQPPASGIFTALDFAEKCDSNTFDEVHFYTTLTSANGIVFNSAHPTDSSAGVTNETIRYFDATQNHGAPISSGYGLTINAAVGIYVQTGVLNWDPAHKVRITTDAKFDNVPQYTWVKQGDGVAGDAEGITVNNLWFDQYKHGGGGGSPSEYWSSGGVPKFQWFLSDGLYLRDVVHGVNGHIFYPNGMLRLSGALQPGMATLPFFASPTFDAAAANSFKVTLSGDVASSRLVNAHAGEFLYFEICQDRAGNHRFAWPANVKGGMSVGLAPSSCSAQGFLFDGVNAYAISTGAAGM